MKKFWSKMKLGQPENNLFFTFFQFYFFHVFLVKVQNIIPVDKKEICTYFISENSKVELHSSNFFFWRLSSNFAIFFL